MRNLVVTCIEAIVAIFIGCVPRAASADERLDIAILGGRVVDGTGAPWYCADVGIRDGKIVEIGRVEPNDAETAIDANGLIVAPGFIDMMGQTASPMIDDPSCAINLLTQGITTINAGEGYSAAPLTAEEGARQGWTTLAEYFALLDIHGLPVNVVQTVGHTQVRRMVLGDVERRPSDEELQRMRELVREGMEAGAIGISTALIYPPAVYARTKEIAALAEVAGQYGGRYYTHMRNEGDLLLEAIDEALDIGRAGNTPVHIFHLKAAGQRNWGKMHLAIARIKAARAEGVQVTADIYPYINNGLGIAAFIHPRHFANGREALLRRLDDEQLRAEIREEMETTGGWENWYRHVGHDWNRVVIGQSNDPRYADLSGQSVAEMAKAKDEDPWATFFNLVQSGAFALPQSMTDANKILAMQQEFVSFCTDVGPAGGSRIASHPRAFGAFPRLLSRYVRDLGAISLERAVAQASAAAANDVLAYDRGRIAEGLAADVIVFDFDKLADRATFANPAALSEGMRHVIVNGQLVLKDGAYTGRRSGRVLRGPGHGQDKAPHGVSTGKHVEKLDCFDQAMHEFLKEHRVPGAALAITDQGRLVFTRSYGYADLATGEQVQPTSLFRIASISKPVTAVAILQLVEQGKLQLDDNVFDILDYDKEIEAAGDEFDRRLRDVTIRHLLDHRGGWDRGQSFDAMFQSVRFARELDAPAPAAPDIVIRAMLKQKLDFEPGHRYAYSNFGYCLLGRVIERLAGQTYEDYVKQHVLLPLGIRAMRIGATRLEGRAAGEVRYYQPGTGKSVFEADADQQIPWPYGAWHLEAMDSHGGWIASAVDLARFAAAFDDPDDCPILKRDSIKTMFARPPGLAGHDENGQPKDVYYSLGWFCRDLGDGRLNYWHTGSLAGTATILIRRHDGRNMISLFNSRVSPSTEHLGRAIDRLLQETADSVETWPTHDQFDDDTSQHLSISISTAVKGSAAWDWTQARTAFVPGDKPQWLTTMSRTEKVGAHGYHDVFLMSSRDGSTWSEPKVIPSLRRAKREDGYEVVAGDLWPTFHEPSGKVLITGKTFNFEGGSKENILREQVAYAVIDPVTGECGPLRTVSLPEQDHDGKPFVAPNAGCHQRVDLPNGEILLPIRYQKSEKQRLYTTIVARCRFDGQTLAYLEHGSEHSIPTARGLYEPSAIRFGDEFFLTMRADDGAYVAKSVDGINYSMHKPWTFDDGELLGSYHTQQHWIRLGGRLYLVYTRRGANNDHIFRHRAPLFIGEVDPNRLAVKRATEQIVLPEHHATLGNSGVCFVSERESWITCAEGRVSLGPRKGEANNVFIARVRLAD